MITFILGMIFVLVAQPLLDGFTSIILSFFEMIKSYMAVVINKNNQKIEGDEGSTNLIGFQYTAEEENFEDDV